MRIVNFLLAIMFLVFAALQVNDPDPVIWILIYGSMAVISILAMFEFYPRKVLIILAVIFVSYSIIDIPSVRTWLQQDDLSVLFDDLATMENLWIEESREFLGLLICVLVLLLNIVRSYKRKGA